MKRARQSDSTPAIGWRLVCSPNSTGECGKNFVCQGQVVYNEVEGEGRGQTEQGVTGRLRILNL